MSATIEAAWIAAGSGLLGVLLGVGGTVTVALVASRNTRKATADTIAAGTAQISAQMAADRRNRIWEQQAAAYTDTIRGVKHWQRVHGAQVEGMVIRAQRDFPPTPVDWPELETRLIAYTSPAVNEVFRTTMAANEIFVFAMQQWEIAIAGFHGPGDSEASLLARESEARSLAEEALTEENRLGAQLVDTIRAELDASAGHPPNPPAPLSPPAEQVSQPDNAS